MSNDRCFEPEVEFKSLIFNAGAINDAAETEPDTVPLGSENSSIRILGWLLPQGDPDEYSLTFSVPKDAHSSRCPRAKVFVHLLTDNSNTPTGNVFRIRLSSLFTGVNGEVKIGDIKTINTGNIRILDSHARFQYRHYVLEFDLSDIIKAEDFALLSVARIPAINDNDFAGDLLLTSIEFRYLSC